MNFKLGFYRDRIQGTKGYFSAVSGPLIIALAVFILAIIINYSTGGFYEDVLISGLIFAILSVGLQVIIGNTGLIFFGQFSFVAIGAYVSGLLTIPISQRKILLPDLPGWLTGLEINLFLSLCAAVVITALVSIAISPIFNKISGLAAAVVSLGLVYITTNVLLQAATYTRGAQTFSGVPGDANLLVVGSVLVIATAIAAIFKYSPYGLFARAGREDSIATASNGISQTLMKMPSLVVGGALSGLAGGIWAHYLTAFSPATFGLDPAIMVVTMVMVGGARSITGALAGAVLVSIWLEFARNIEGGLVVFSRTLPMPPEFGSLTISLGLVLILLLRPAGIFMSLEFQCFRIDPCEKNTTGKEN